MNCRRVCEWAVALKAGATYVDAAFGFLLSCRAGVSSLFCIYFEDPLVQQSGKRCKPGIEKEKKKGERSRQSGLQRLYCLLQMGHQSHGETREQGLFV